MTTVVQQTSNVVPTAFKLRDDLKTTIKGLGIAEIVIGSLSVIFGIVLSVLPSNFLNTGIGIWGAIALIVAGGLGIGAAGSYSSLCMLNCHMAFSIIAAVFQGIMLIVAPIRAAYYTYFVSALSGLYVVLSLLAAVGLILSIVSSAYCCRASPGCCGNPNMQPYPQQTIITTTTTQQPVVMQGGQVLAPGYVAQQQPMVQTQVPYQQPVQQYQQPMQSYPPMQQPGPAGAPQQAAPFSKEQEAFGQPAPTTGSQPPPYSS